MVYLAPFAVALAALSALPTSMAAAHRAMVVHEEREVPAHFALAGTPSPDTPISLKIALTATDMSGLEKVAWDVSTPGNPLYGQHLNYDETRAYAAPHPETVSAVTKWLNENGITNLTTSGAFNDWLAFTVPISTANSLLKANFQKFSEVGGPTELTRTLSYSIPVDLKQHVDLVYPTTDFVRLSKGPRFEVHKTLDKLATRDVSASCQSAITPQCLQALYGIPTTSATNSSNNNTIGVSAFLNQWAEKADLEQFLKAYRTDIPSTTTFQEQNLDGGMDPQLPGAAGIEANLDTQYTVGVATGVPVTLFSVGSANTDGGLDGFLDLANNLLNQTTTPGVLTTRFNEGDVTQALAVNLCNAYMMLGGRGTSVIYASGDGGVSGSQSQNCTTFVPTFPSGCPWVTSVGSTNLTNNDAGNLTETAATFSAGGFSNYFTIPSYQNDAVNLYLDGLGSMYSGKYNSSRKARAYPDVSTNGVNYTIILNDVLQIIGLKASVGGTSCSSPTFASIIALINDRLIGVGKPRLGFLNNRLYAKATSGAFNDITTGSNPGCGTNGFPAAQGWDPVTGLGTPNFGNLLAAAMG
ncbi:family S53 protease [Gymnopus androsaceus JB14]|uniref:Family S53 protease n=1 Tax=Gymnopus androsaceus JB14 TaxID=1447944 RepID=A0A6A4I0L4_9AGAR|nr:family S53 protease [Gymnopus androsaceus JB14]